MKFHKYILLAGIGLSIGAGLIGSSKVHAEANDGAINERWENQHLLPGQA